MLPSQLSALPAERRPPAGANGSSISLSQAPQDQCVIGQERPIPPIDAGWREAPEMALALSSPHGDAATLYRGHPIETPDGRA